MVYKILIVGFGNIGKYHFQSILDSNKAYDVTILDRSKVALKNANDTFDCSNRKIKFNLMNTTGKLNAHYHLCIIAVPSENRLRIFKQILKKSKIRNFILEKFLFQKISHYKEADILIKKNKLNVWVNCWRRSFQLYKNIKVDLNNKEKYNIELKGDEWGLACNSIHFLDLFCWINNYKKLSLNCSKIDNKIWSAKRKGYIEFYGVLMGRECNNKISLSCTSGQKKRLKIKLVNNKKTILINELKGIARIKTKRGTKKIEFTSPKVSTLTHMIIQNILKNKKCYLPTYKESAELHIIMLKAFLRKESCIKNSYVRRLRIT